MEDDSINIKWEVSDGYIGKDRPQYTKIYINDLDDIETKEEIIDFISSIIQEDFETNISWDANFSELEDYFKYRGI